MKKMLMRDTKEWIKLIMNELRSNDEVEAIYLFGSYGKGNAKPISDIDICVLTKRNISKRVKEEILSNSSKNIDISIFWRYRRLLTQRRNCGRLRNGS
ncbi:MAG TPA: nucleotidyltransferase domain-containing protein [Methanophagales archaeon]|nr:nucleotidyltransferase domain-containing protein [Methanophagales archaeon]